MLVGAYLVRRRPVRRCKRSRGADRRSRMGIRYAPFTRPSSAPSPRN